MLESLLPISPLRRYLLLNDGPGAGGDGGGPGGSGDGQGGAGGSSGAATFTPPKDQDEFDAMVGSRLAREGRTATRATEERIAAELGVSVADAKQIIADHRAAEDARKDEVTRANDEKTRAEAERDAARQAATAAQLETKIERRLLTAGVGRGLDVAGAEKALARARRAMDIAPDADDDAISAEIEALKVDIPSLFGAEVAPPPAGGPVTPPPPPPPGGPGSGGESEYDRAAREARANFGHLAR